jgi:hypothetical protein
MAGSGSLPGLMLAYDPQAEVRVHDRDRMSKLYSLRRWNKMGTKSHAEAFSDGAAMTGEQGLGSPGREDEFRIEILSWDWDLAVAISSQMTPVEHRFQGGLSYIRGFQLWGRVVEPEAVRGKTVRIWIYPFGPELSFGPDELDEVGRIHLRPGSGNKTDWTASLLLPEDAVATLATCLGTVTKYLFIRIFEADANEASIDHYAFSASLPERPSGATPQR